MTTNLILEPKKRFDHLYEEDKNVARCNVAIYVESLDLQGLNPEQRVLKLYKVYQLLKQDADRCKRKDYLHFADKQYCLYNIFYCRQLIYQCDEEPHLLEGLTLYEKLKCIIVLLTEAKARLPLFTFVDFLEGVMNVVFYVLHERPTGTSKKDYLKMKNWLAQKKLDCVNLECGKIRERFMNEVKGSLQVMDDVRSENQLLKELFQNDRPLTVHQLTAILSRLRGLMPNALPDDSSEFHRLFYQLDHRKNFTSVFSPKMLQSAHENILAGKLSNIPICCWSLMKYEKWLTDVLEGKMSINNTPDDDYGLLFYQTYEKGKAISEKLKSYFYHRYPYGTVSHEQYKSVIWEALKKCRREFNDLKYPEYYQLLLNKENTKYYFINHCFLDIDSINHTCQLEQTVVLNEMIRFYKDKLSHIDQSLVHPRLNFTNLKNDFEEIISTMVPNPEISERLQKAINEAYQAWSKRVPLLFIIENLKDTIDKIFSDAITHLVELLDSQPGIIKETYARKLLKELGIRALIKPGFGQGLDKYLKDLKKLLKMELKYTQDEQSSPLINPEIPFQEMQMQVIKPDSNKTLAFNYNKKRDDRLYLVLDALLLLEALPPGTTLAQFRKLFNGKKVIHPIQWLAAQGDLLVFIKEATSNGQLTYPHQQLWNIAVKCFVKPDGSNFNVTVLKASRSTNRASKFMRAANLF